MSKLDELAKSSGVTILCEMGLDPGIGNFFTLDNIDINGATTSPYNFAWKSFLNQSTETKSVLPECV